MKKITIVFTLLYFMWSNVAAANIVNPMQKYTYERMKHDIWELKDNYKNDLSVKTIGYSHFGRKIIAVKLGKGDKNILLIGSHHGREWLTSSLLMEMLETYSKSYHKNEKLGPFDPKILDEVAIWFVPMLNPDGVTIQQGGIEKFPRYQREKISIMNLRSKNFSRWKANGLGVDLNRQYSVGWGRIPRKKAPVPIYQFYKGKRPMEAHETKAIVKFTNKVDPLMAVTYHTAGREIYWHYDNGKNTNRDYEIARAAANLTGYKLATPPKNATGAGYTDWFITTFHRPAMTIEISYLVGEKNPPLGVFSEEWKRNQYVGMMLANKAKNIQELYLRK